MDEKLADITPLRRKGIELEDAVQYVQAAIANGATPGTKNKPNAIIVFITDDVGVTHKVFGKTRLGDWGLMNAAVIGKILGAKMQRRR
jgi:hypothetical protein